MTSTKSSTSLDRQKEYEDQKDRVNVLRFKLEQDQNAYYDAQSRYRETQIKFDQALIALNWLKEELEGTGSV